MRIFVSGARGFVGQHLVANLHAQGATIGTDRVITPRMDANKPNSIRKALMEFEADIVFHLAAISATRPTFDALPEMFAINCELPIALATICKDLPKPPIMVFISTSMVYGAAFTNIPADENTLMAPHNSYATSKAIADRVLGEMAYLYPRIIRMRPGNHSGPKQSPDFFVPVIAKQIAAIEANKQDPVLQIGPTHDRIDFLDIRDVVRAYGIVATKAEDLCQAFGTDAVFNIGSGVPVPLQEMLAYMTGKSTRKITIEPRSDMVVGDARTVALDASRFRKATGWQPQYSWQDMLDQVLAYWRARMAA
ncbi:MAG: GDP-mannose 4,6-dehydratase [Pseudomonadota bacterium]